MRTEFLPYPTEEGVFGPEVVVSTISGDGCLRSQTTTVGRHPETPAANAFLAWVGRPVLVVSEGVQVADAANVARGLRTFLQQENLPVLITTPHNANAADASAISDDPSNAPERELARAMAFVLVQASWLESKIIRIQLNGCTHEFRSEMRERQGGGFWPYVG
jgi:hypothetical protein